MMRRYLQLLVLVALFLSMSCAVVQAGDWVERSDAPCSGGYGEAVVGTGDNIYVARCLYATRTPSFSRYDPDTDSWTSMSTSGLPSGAFRSGTALTWDHDTHIYALCGGRYSDNSRTLFYRYSISGNNWEQLADTPHAQGAGDAIAWSEHYDQVYAMIGSNARGTVFARYSYNSWETLTFNPNWTFTDDGASLVSVGAHLYALRGEYSEHTPNGDFARYHIPTAAWVDISDIPESDGIGDGGSLLYIGDWMSEHDDHIFALGGGGVYEDPGYNFYRYSISGNDWEQLEQIPCPIGFYVGNRLGYANNHIYYWQGSPMSDLWVCGGDAFYMFNWYPPNLTCICGDICVNENGWWRDDGAFNSNDTPIQSAVDNADACDSIYVYNGSYTENVDVDKRITLIGEGADVAIVTAASSSDHVFHVTVDYVTILGFTVTGATGQRAGIYLDTADHCNISDNNASGNFKGIYLWSSSNYNTLTNNTANSNGCYGIHLSFSSSNTLENNIANLNNHDGIYLYSSSNYNTLTNNTANSNHEYGICLDYSSSNTLENNTISGNTYNLRVSGYALSHYTQSIDTSNTVDGKPIYYWVNQQDKAIPCDAGFVGVVNSTNITVSDLILTKNGKGVLFAYTENSRIENVATNSNDRYGIHLCSSNNNTLTNNTANSNNWYGIYLSSSNNNTLTNNPANSNTYDGIHLRSSNNNTLTNNTANSNNWYGIYLWSSNNNTLTNNTANSNTYDGIWLRESNNNTLTNNTVSNNDDGGITLWESCNNLLYHNNLINNSGNAYDSSSDPVCTNFWNSSTEGNYYSDYDGCDNDTDGIGDTPHPISGGSSVDHFPLMQPWSKDTQQKGDLDGDGQITAADAAIALQMAVSGERDDDADMDGDGRVSSVDALMILQVAAGAIEL